jgi:pimeloyl-ACP methyl ester carboxylesterase
MIKEWHLVAGLLAALLCSSTAAGAVERAGFAPCTDAQAQPALHASLCAREPVSLSAAAPAGEQLSLFVRKFPAAGRSRGTVWLVAGGPGESGASLYPFIDRLRRSFPGFDLLVPDHRGTGYSSRLCPAEEAVSSPGGMALAGAEWGSCFGQLSAQPERTRQFTLTNAAYDLRQLVLRHQDGKPVYVYAVSYGTQLVLRALQAGPLPVTGLVLDSLVPLQTDDKWDLSRRSQVVDMVGRQVLAGCDADPQCAAVLGEPAADVYRRVLASAPQRSGLLAAVPGASLPRLLGSLLDIPALRARLPHLLRELDAERGDELASVLARLKETGAALTGYPQSPLSIPLVSIISGAENNLRPALTAAALKAEEDSMLFTSPLPGLLLQPTLPLYARDDYFGKQPAWLPPTLVFSGTLDPKTPYAAAVEHAALLRRSGQVRQVAVTGMPHFILWVAPDCFERHTRAFVGGGAASGTDAACAPATLAEPAAMRGGANPGVQRLPPALPSQSH